MCARSPLRQHIPLRIDHQPQAALAVIEGGAPAAGVLAGAALAEQGDLALGHELAERAYLQAEATGDAGAVDLDRRCVRLVAQSATANRKLRRLEVVRRT